MREKLKSSMNKFQGPDDNLVQANYEKQMIFPSVSVAYSTIAYSSKQLVRAKSERPAQQLNLLSFFKLQMKMIITNENRKWIMTNENEYVKIQNDNYKWRHLKWLGLSYHVTSITMSAVYVYWFGNILLLLSKIIS